MKKNVMPFLPQYKKKLLSGKKNLTVRIGKEMGRYRKGREYDAQSYSGKDWGFKVRVNSIINTKFKDLHKHVPKQVAKMKDFKKLEPKDKAQVIHIKPLIDLSHKDKTMKEVKKEAVQLSKRAALIPPPPETETVWRWVEKIYARWALNNMTEKIEEDLVDFVMMRRQAIEDAETDKPTRMGYATTDVDINYDDWKRYSFDYEKSFSDANKSFLQRGIESGMQGKAPLYVKIEMKVQEETSLGEWDEAADPTLSIFVPQEYLTPPGLEEYNGFKGLLRSTVVHEMRHLVQTIINWGKRLSKEIPGTEGWKYGPAGLPTTRTPGHEPHGYKIEELRKWKEKLKRVPTQEERKTLEKEREKELERTRLPHSLRDIEYHTNIGTIADEWKQGFEGKFPKYAINEALKAFLAAPPYYTRGGIDKPFFIGPEDLSEVSLTPRVWPNNFFVNLRLKMDDEAQNRADEEKAAAEHITAIDFVLKLRLKDIERATNETEKARLLKDYEQSKLLRERVVRRLAELRARPMGVWEKRYRDAVNKFLSEITRS